MTNFSESARFDYYARMAAAPPRPADALRGGKWINDRGIQRWVEVEEPPAPTPAPTLVEIHQLVACPTCKAKVDQSCKTRGGNPAASHRSRIASRRCPCGEVAPRNHAFCEACQHESRVTSWRDAQARLRQRRRDVA